MKVIRRTALTFLLALSLGPALAQSIDVGGAKFEPTSELAGQKLVLNGAGVRYRAVFKVYAAGLYLKAKADETDAIQKMDGPKRVTLKLLRELDGKVLGKAFTDGMEKNLQPEERMRTINGIFKFGQIFADIKKAAPGTVINVDWVPGVGATVTLDGKPAGEPIKEAEFYNALLRIWIGEKPADDKLKAQLLGRPAG
jgi:Chalcone isomerase-like